MRSTLLVLLAGVALSCLACETVLGIEDRNVWRGSEGGNTDASGGDATVEADVFDPPPGCSLPAQGAAAVRLGHLMPSRRRMDFCLGRDGVFDGVVPVLFGSGRDCPNGLGYRDITAVFGVDPGTYAVRVVEAGASCSSKPVAETDVDIEAGATAALHLLGTEQEPAIVRLRESRPTGVSQALVRFVHAAPSEGPVDLGFSTGSELPAGLAGVMFPNVSQGGTAAPGASGVFGEVDGDGYVSLQMIGAISFGAATAGQDAVRAVCTRSAPPGTSTTLFLLGSESDPEFPFELWGCSESEASGVLADCGSVAPVDLTFALYNVYLNGVWAVEAPRRGPLLESISAVDADVLVLSEAWSDEDKIAFAQAAKGSFPHAHWVSTDFATEADDPRDVSGDVPPAYEEPPCAPVLSDLNEALDCVRDSCTDAGTEEGYLVTQDTTGCLTKNCIAKLMALSAPIGQACWRCMLLELQSFHTIGETRQDCSEEPLARYSYDGMAAPLLLSKYPLSDRTAYVLPATSWRAVILRATLELDGGQKVDVYGGNLAYLHEDCLTRPYTGHYGNGAPCPDAYVQEQLLQANRLVAWIGERSTRLRRPAFIALDTDTGLAFDGEGQASLAERSPEVFHALQAGLAVASPANYVPLCTLCRDNPLITPPPMTPAGSNTWTQHLFLQNLPVTTVRSMDRFLTEAVHDFTEGDQTYEIPPSPHYGIRSAIRVRR
jgi:hypothetical protein